MNHEQANVINTSLEKVAKGSMIFFVGSIVGMLFSFFGRILFARFFSLDEYGLLSLGLTILSISAIIGTLGIQQGIVRNIPYYIGRKQKEYVSSLVTWSLIFCLIMGFAIAFVLFLFSDFIAINIFNAPDFSLLLKLFSFAVPFHIMTIILTSIFQGFKRIREKVIFSELGVKILFPFLLSIVFFLNGSVILGITAYVASEVMIAISFLIYYFVIKKKIIEKTEMKLNKTVGKQLLLFSLPLLSVGFMIHLLGSTDTFMLGFFKTSSEVGVYNAAKPLAMFISLGLAMINFLFLPISSELYGMNKEKELKRIYQILTKWLVCATYPLLLIFLLFPDVIIGSSFGNDYLSGAVAFQFLAVGYFMSNFLGPNREVLTVIGKTKFLMWVTLLAMLLNILFNFLLIPAYGVAGAALATAISICIIEAIRSFKVYVITGINPFGKNTIRPLFLSSIFIIIIFMVLDHYIVVKYWMIPVLFILFLLIQLASLFVTKSIDEEDLDFLRMIRNKLRYN